MNEMNFSATLISLLIYFIQIIGDNVLLNARNESASSRWLFFLFVLSIKTLTKLLIKSNNYIYIDTNSYDNILSYQLIKKGKIMIIIVGLLLILYFE